MTHGFLSDVQILRKKKKRKKKLRFTLLLNGSDMTGSLSFQ